MKKTTIQIFITNKKDNTTEKETSNKIICRFNDLFDYANKIHNVPKCIVINIDTPITRKDINQVIFKFVKILEERGKIQSYDTVYHLPSSLGVDKYNNIFTQNYKYLEGRFGINVFE
jgi:hypothetical protein